VGRGSLPAIDIENFAESAFSFYIEQLFRLSEGMAPARHLRMKVRGTFGIDVSWAIQEDPAGQFSCPEIQQFSRPHMALIPLRTDHRKNQ
jgi:hypothetical protein